jgi:hypothetical protein
VPAPLGAGRLAGGGGGLDRVALLAFGVGFARAFLLLHWPIDIPGGLLLGVLLLGLLVAAAGAFEPEGVPDPAEAAEAPAARQAITARHP